MRSTGRLFVRITDTVDERNDPFARSAAVALLSQNYQALGQWPLAVTLANHSPEQLRAVERLGSEELEDLVDSLSQPHV